MKTIPVFGTRGLIPILAAAFGVSVGFASPAFAQNVWGTSVIVNPDGKVTYLTPGGIYSEAVGINNSGQVAGNRFEYPNARAFITGPNGIGMTDIGTLDKDFRYSVASGINDAGQVVGQTYSDAYGYHAFMTGHNGTGLTGFRGDEATAINESGQVVINAFFEEPHYAFITGPNGIGMTNLGGLGGIATFANDINDVGQVAGSSYIEGGYSPHAFITGPNGKGMTDLGTFGANYSVATGINDSGRVVGEYHNSVHDFSPHAFITGPNGKGAADLGTLGGDESYASGINDSGRVVGYSTTADGSRHAFITGPGGMGMTDLNSIADLPSGVYLRSAKGINNLGQVIATLALIPEPGSYALMLAGLGLVGFMARGKRVADNSVARG